VARRLATAVASGRASHTRADPKPTQSLSRLAT